MAYLQQFHRSRSDVSDEAASSSMPAHVPAAMSSRPRVSHRSTTSMSALLALQVTSAAPSLTNTPTTVSSSLGSNNGADYINYVYDFNTRPLPPRRNPLSFDGAKGIELVIPLVAPASPTSDVSNVATEGRDLWEKKVIVKKGSNDNVDGAGLGALFK
jgi:hypothetical protein